jgi:glycosyltransferase involved in cell wall biosynthesis
VLARDTKFLLIAFKFPPYAGVGGFRWSKLCKYLARLGHEIHVVTVNWQQQGPNTLMGDVQHSNIIVHPIPSGYPHNLRQRVFENRSLNNIKNGFFVYVLNRYFFPDGAAQRWGRYLLPCCKTLLQKERIKVVVATGGPFQANRWVAVLKERNHHIRLIQDFRDPWADDPAKSRSISRLAAARAWQKMSVEVADCVVAVTDGLLRLYLQGACQEKGFVISNGYDPEDAELRGDGGSGETGFSFIYIGDVGPSRQEPLRSFLEAVRQVRVGIPNIRVTLVGGYRRMPEKEFSDLIEEGILELHPYVSHKTVLEMVKQHTYTLQLNAKMYPYLVSTKIYEYGMLKVPTISLNYGGEIERLVLDRDLGYSVNVERDDIAAFITHLYKQPWRQFSFDVGDFAYDRLAARYSKLINGDL